MLKSFPVCVKPHSMAAEFGAVRCTQNSETLGKRRSKETEKEERATF